MGDLLISLLKPYDINLRENISINFFKNSEWVLITHEKFHNYISSFCSWLRDNARVSHTYVGLYLDISHTYPPIVFGLLQLNAAFVCLDPYANFSWNKRLIDKLGIHFILTNQPEKMLSNLEIFKGFAYRGAVILFEEEVHLMVKETGEIKNYDGPLAYAIQTSGSTGTPKIVQVSYSSICQNVLHLRSLLRITQEDNIYMGTPVTFDPSVVELFLAFISGASLSIVEKAVREDFYTLADVLFASNERSITFLQTTPSLFRRWPTHLIQSKLFGARSKLRVILLGGETFPEKAYVQSLKVPSHVELYNIYGITEVSCWASLKLINNFNEDPSIGKPFHDTLFQLEDCEIDSIGELSIGSSTRICKIDDEIYSDLIQQAPIYRKTGDICQFKNGEYFYLGRKSRITKRWGVRVNPVEIERIAESSEGVARAVCVNKILGSCKMICLFVVSKEDLDIDELKIKLKNSLPTASMPDRIQIIKELPITMHGKLDVDFLDSCIETKSSSSPTEHFCRLWKQYTSIMNLDQDSKFLLSGGNSFTALQLTSQMEFCFNRSFEYLLNALLQNCSFQNCCEIISREQNLTGSIDSANMIESDRKRKEIANVFIHPEKMLKTSLPSTSTPLEERVCCTMCKGRIKNIIDTNIHYSQFFKNLNLKEYWKYNLGKCVDASPLGVKFMSGRNVVIIGSHSGRIVAMGLNKSVISECKLPDRIEASPCISPCGNYYFIGCYDGRMYKIGLRNGEIVWSYSTGNIIKCEPITFRECLLFGSYDKFFYSLELKNGSLRWRTALKGAISATPIILNEMIYVGTLNGSLAAIDFASGSISYEITMPPVFASLAVEEDLIIILDVKGEVHWYDSTNGVQVNNFKTNDMLFSSPLIHYKESKSLTYILFGCQDGNLYCLEERSLAWKTNLGSHIVASPFLIHSDQMLVVSVTTNGIVHLLNFEDGSILSKYPLPHEVYSSPIAMDGKIVLGCRDDNVYILEFDN